MAVDCVHADLYSAFALAVPSAAPDWRTAMPATTALTQSVSVPGGCRARAGRSGVPHPTVPAAQALPRPRAEPVVGPAALHRWFERLGAWADAQPRHHRLGDWMNWRG
jgi:hypothetical protein